MLIKDKWICTGCKWTGQECDIRKEIVFAQTWKTPAEWKWYCPDCNQTDTIKEDDERD